MSKYYMYTYYLSKPTTIRRPSIFSHIILSNNISICIYTYAHMPNDVYLLVKVKYQIIMNLLISVRSVHLIP